MDIVKAQHEDATIARVLQLLKTSHKPSVTEIRRETPQVRKYLCKWHQLNVNKKNGILYNKEQLVLPIEIIDIECVLMTNHVSTFSPCVPF